jgi:hypothetical protein
VGRRVQFWRCLGDDRCKLFDYLYCGHELFFVIQFGMIYSIVCSILRTEHHLYVTMRLSIVLLSVREIVRMILIMRWILMRYRQSLTL